MDINTVQSTNSAASNSPVLKESSSVLSSDFETFLKMLTVQAKYQDPLEPIDSSEYSAQLAQFSSVEQQVLTNDLLTALTGQLGGSGMAQFASWIGMEARTTAPKFFNGDPITLNPNPAAGADEIALVVTNQAGDIVDRTLLPPSSTPVEWSGINEYGKAFPDGLYTFKIESRAQGSVTATSVAETYSRVTETRIENGKSLLILEGGSSVSSEDISALREPA